MLLTHRPQRFLRRGGPFGVAATRRHLEVPPLQVAYRLHKTTVELIAIRPAEEG